MKFRRILSFLLALIAAASLAACGSREQIENTPSAPAADVLETITPTVPTSAEIGPHTEMIPGLTVPDDLVIFDQYGITITVKECIQQMIGDQISVQGFLLHVENSNDVGAAVTCEDMPGVVNGCSMAVHFAADVPAKGSADEEVTVSHAIMKQAGIRQIGQMDLLMSIYMEDCGGLHQNIPAESIKTSAFDQTDPEPEIPGTVVYEQNDLRITVEPFDHFGEARTMDHPDLSFYAENTGDADVKLALRSCAVNGMEVDARSQGALVPAHGKAINVIAIMAKDMEDPFKDLVFSFDVLNPETSEVLGSTGDLQYTIP